MEVVTPLDVLISSKKESRRVGDEPQDLIVLSIANNLT